MPITLSKIVSNTANVSFAYGADTVNVVYYPSKLTEKTLADIQSFSTLSDATIQDSFSALNDTLASLIKSWDVYEDDAQTTMFPLDASRLPELPISFRASCLQAIMADIRPETIAPTPINQTQS